MLGIYPEIQQAAIDTITGPLWQIISNWWWFLLPFALQKPFLFLWEQWRIENWLVTVYQPTLYEVTLPRDNPKPMRAMEKVMNSVHSSIYQPPDWWERWIEGQIQTSISFEIVSAEGKIHFYYRVHDAYADAVKSAFYAEFPSIEINKVEDYTKSVPQDIPNEDWDLWGASYRFLKDKPEENAYPLLTYRDFERETELPEQKIDPVANLLEALSAVGEKEHFWIQMTCTPLTQNESNWIELGKQLRDKLARREVTANGTQKIKFRPMVVDALDFLVTGKVPENPTVEETAKETYFAPEMRLTPGERDIIEAVERKISKPGFNTNIRFVFSGKRGYWQKAKLRLAFAFFGSYATENLNTLIPAVNLTKIHKSWFLPLNLMRPRRMYLRQRKLFRNYLIRVAPYFPRSPGPGKFILNTEEMASLYHFPSWEVSPVPGVSRIESKKKPAPELPEEE